MSDVMLHGVLNMPLPDNPADMDLVTWIQFRDRARQASTEIIALRAQLAEAQAQAHTARECIEYFADGDNWLRDGKLDPNSGNFTGTIHARAALALIQTTTARPDAAKKE
jgi:hypothetical protein